MPYTDEFNRKYLQKKRQVGNKEEGLFEAMKEMIQGGAQFTDIFRERKEKTYKWKRQF